eukprot:gnl/Chilomastix_cuspidata/2260.p1 GENE.gnl/Chilomastix_cuspidata/2260~~gnl/Chilomastix_cuspidata/2260.p1  ORF type:complete len:357 (-),score=114.80 gnl/Chilomastix_cuspidata/2260:84-1154(-)
MISTTRARFSRACGVVAAQLPRVLLTDCTNPYVNLSTEEFLLDNLPVERGPTLYLWRNEPVVVIGRNQNPHSECDIQAMKEDGVHLARRKSGGGAVYHDLGNTNFTIVNSKKGMDVASNLEFICSALARLGVAAEPSGRNDITVGGRKVSGSAFRFLPERAFHHGTLMTSVDLDAIPRYLTPPRQKLEAKGVASVRARVANLSEYAPVDAAAVEGAIIDAFEALHGPSDAHRFSEAELRATDFIGKTAHELVQPAWVLGNIPSYGVSRTERFDWGTVEVALEFGNVGGTFIVKDAAVHSDALFTAGVACVPNLLRGRELSRSEFEATLLRAQDLPLGTEDRAIAADIVRWVADWAL